jgi:hypothetical protein
MAALPLPMITWAMSADGWPIYRAPDAAGNQERLQIVGVQTVDSAGQVYAVNAQGISTDGATPPAPIPQPGIATRQRDLVMHY